MKPKSKHKVLRVETQPLKPFSIRERKSGGWLCANTADPRKWHYSNNPGCTGVTQYATLEEAEKICRTLKNHEVVEFKD